MSVDVYISIVYIMPTIWGISISCWVSLPLGPSGPGLRGCMSIGVYIDTVNIMPTIEGVFIRGDRRRKYGCFFGKLPNGLDPPPPRPFLSDPGIPGVRSMGPSVCHSLSN